MVAAHSGALAGEQAAWDAFCAATGAIHVSDLAEFSDTLELFSAGRRAKRGGIATVHDSGAERALLADLAHELGVEFADLAPDTLTTIGGLLDDGLAATNPLDVWGTGADTRNLFGACLRAMVDDPAVAVTALAVDLVTEFDGDTAYADAVSDVAKDTDAPIAVLTSVASAIDPPTAEQLRDSGIAVLEGARSGLAALGHLARWPLPVDRADATVRADRRERWVSRIAAGGVAHFELLADYGVPVVDIRTADSAGAALAAADAVGYPIALKTVGATHKSDVGGVVLGLRDRHSLGAAYAAMAESLGPAVTVEPMVEAGVEISVGIVRDPGFGPLLIVAAGGTLVELLADRGSPARRCRMQAPAACSTAYASARCCTVARPTCSGYRRAGGRDRGVLADGDRDRRRGGRRRGQPGDRVCAGGWWGRCPRSGEGGADTAGDGTSDPTGPYTRSSTGSRSSARRRSSRSTTSSRTRSARPTRRSRPTSKACSSRSRTRACGRSSSTRSSAARASASSSSAC